MVQGIKQFNTFGHSFAKKVVVACGFAGVLCYGFIMGIASLCAIGKGMNHSMVI